jgi:hypothetical protein
VILFLSIPFDVAYKYAHVFIWTNTNYITLRAMAKKTTKPRAVPTPAEKPAPAEPEKSIEKPSENIERALVDMDGAESGKPVRNELPNSSGNAPATAQASHNDTEPLSLIGSIKRGFILFFKEISDKESLRFLGIAILVIGVSLGIAFALGQATYGFLESNASNAGHLYGILTSVIAFFIFARYLRHKKDILYVRRFLVTYFIIYFCIVMLILAFLQGNEVYFLSTLGNSFILFSAYTLIIFILNPEILGVLGTGGNIRKLFLSGQHVRLILIYLFIAVIQVTGFSLLDNAIQLHSVGGTLAYTGVPGGGTGTWFDFFYFSMITFATIGYGDMHPALPVSELASTIQALLSHVISILFLAVLLLYLSSSAPAATDKDQNNE